MFLRINGKKELVFYRAQTRIAHHGQDDKHVAEYGHQWDGDHQKAE